jgi:hypothetical protein
MISKYLIQLLLEAPTITALVSTRIASKKVPQWTDVDNDNPSPYVTIKQDRGTHEKCTQGRIGLQDAVLLVTVHALTVKLADQVLDVISKYLDGTANSTNVSITAGSHTVTMKACLQEDDTEEEDWLPSPHMDEIGLHTASARFRVWCTEET